jgi:hypothetical protein
MTSQQQGQSPNNSASRVLAIMERVRFQPKAVKPNPNATFRERWRAVLTPNVNDVTELHLRLSEVQREIDLIEIFGKETEPSQSRWISQFAYLRAEFSTDHIDISINNRPLQDSLLYVVEYFAQRMPNESTDVKASLDELHEKVAKLFQEVSGSEIQPSLKSWVLELLAMIQNGIQRFFISGSRGLRRELFKIVGTLHERYDELEKVQPETAKSLGQIVADYANITTILTGAIGLGQATAKLLGVSVGGDTL